MTNEQTKNSSNWYLHLLQLPAGGFFEGWRVPFGAQGEACQRPPLSLLQKAGNSKRLGGKNRRGPAIRPYANRASMRIRGEFAHSRRTQGGAGKAQPQNLPHVLAARSCAQPTSGRERAAERASESPRADAG